jgi:hypothetical protein
VWAVGGGGGTTPFRKKKNQHIPSFTGQKTPPSQDLNSTGELCVVGYIWAQKTPPDLCGSLFAGGEELSQNAHTSVMFSFYFIMKSDKIRGFLQ